MAQAAQTPAPAPPQTPRQGPPQAAQVPLPTLEQSFELLKDFKPGADSTVLIPIERAVMEVHGNETARAALEKRLLAYLGGSYSSVTRAVVCRHLALIGSAASVPAVTPLILDEELSVHARNVLEHVPGPESEKALRDALYATKDFPGLTGKLTCSQFGDCGAVKFVGVKVEQPDAGLDALKSNVLFTYP